MLKDMKVDDGLVRSNPKIVLIGSLSVIKFIAFILYFVYLKMFSFKRMQKEPKVCVHAKATAMCHETRAGTL
jgi:hypothetical protein